MTVKTLFFILWALLVFGCSHHQGGQSVTYVIKATPTTQKDQSGTTCGQAQGQLAISSSGKVTGKVTDSYQRTYDIIGSADNQGQVSGGFAINRRNIARYEGSFSADEGQGEWEDIWGCKGVWVATET